ncbi:MAG: hypothetical protein WC709_12820 [Thermoleophilia bacterium]
MVTKPYRKHLEAAAAVAVLVLAAAWAALLAPAAAQAAPTPFVISIAMGGQAGPDIAGSLVVWTDFRNGSADIYARNLSTRNTFPVSRATGSQDNPSVTRTEAGGATEYVAVWVDSRYHSGSEARDILGRNITRSTNFIAARNARLKWYPKIVDHWVVWIEADAAAGPYYVKARNLAARTSYLVATTKVLSSVGLGRRLVGSKTVYTAVYAAGTGNISGRDLPGGTPFAISRDTRFEWMPEISGNRVVWWQAGGRVMLFNLKTHTRLFVHLGARPRVDGALVAWDGGGQGGTFTISYTAGADISVRDLARGVTIRIGQPDLTCLFPALSGNVVVWESGPADRVLSHTHIYGARLK